MLHKTDVNRCGYLLLRPPPSNVCRSRFGGQDYKSSFLYHYLRVLASACENMWGGSGRASWKARASPAGRSSKSHVRLLTDAK